MTTIAFQSTERFIGFGNLAYTLLSALVSLAAQSLTPFVFGMSFVHYLMYIGAFADHERISFGKFKRNVIYFKAVALTCLALLGLAHFNGEVSAVAVIAAGFGIAGLASWRLGLNRTYFAHEFGFADGRRETRFPYGAIPHPMTIGSMFGILGFYLIDGFRIAYPWLVPIHVALYTLHLLQEVYAEEDIGPMPAQTDSMQLT